MVKIKEDKVYGFREFKFSEHSNAFLLRMFWVTSLEDLTRNFLSGLQDTDEVGFFLFHSAPLSSTMDNKTSGLFQKGSLWSGNIPSEIWLKPQITCCSVYSICGKWQNVGCPRTPSLCFIFFLSVFLPFPAHQGLSDSIAQPLLQKKQLSVSHRLECKDGLSIPNLEEGKQDKSNTSFPHRGWDGEKAWLILHKLCFLPMRNFCFYSALGEYSEGQISSATSVK